MQNSKGEKKNFSRYLAFELYDAQLEPLEEDIPSNPEQLMEKTKPSKQKRSKKVEKKDYDSAQHVLLLTSSCIKALTDRLGLDAKKCFYGLVEFKQQQGQSKMGRLYPIYRKLKTVPVLFLSVIYQNNNQKEIDAVYLWQINRLYLYEENMKFMSVDCRRIDEKIARGPSFLLLAKIVPEDGENIVEAKLLGESRLLVKSITKDSFVSIKIYNIEDFYLTFRINPYDHCDILANNYFCSKTVAKFIKNEEDLVWNFDFWERKHIEELYLNTPKVEEIKEEETKDNFDLSQSIVSRSCSVLKTCKDLNISLEQAFCPIPVEHFENWQIFKDDSTSTFLVLGYGKFEVCSFPEVGSIHSTRNLNNHLYLLSTQGQIFSLDLSHLPTLIINKSPIASFGDLSGKDFQWQVIEFCDSAQSPKVEHVVYSLQNKIYAIPLIAENAVANIVLELDVNDVDWNIFLAQNITEDLGSNNVPIIVYVKGGSLFFYNVKTQQNKSFDVIYSNENKLNKRWNIIPAKDGHLYLHDPLFENLLIHINHGLDVGTIFSEEFTLFDVECYDTRKKNNSSNKKKKFQVEGFDKKIMLLVGDEEPYYEDNINYIYKFENDSSIPIVEEAKLSDKKLSNNSKTQKEEEKLKALKEIEKIKQDIALINKKESTIDESNKLLKALRDKISVEVGNHFRTNGLKIKNSRVKRVQSQTRVPLEDRIEDVFTECSNAFEQVKQEKQRIKRQRDREKTKTKNNKRNFRNRSVEEI